MTVRKIVPNIHTDAPGQVKDFYEGLLGMHLAMDMGWITTFTAADDPKQQVSFASEGGGGTPVPAISVEVDDVTALYQRMVDAGAEITYPLTKEPWGVRRFFVRDPAGTLLNVLEHI